MPDTAVLCPSVFPEACSKQSSIENIAVQHGTIPESGPGFTCCAVRRSLPLSGACGRAAVAAIAGCTVAVCIATAGILQPGCVSMQQILIAAERNRLCCAAAGAIRAAAAAIGAGTGLLLLLPRLQHERKE